MPVNDKELKELRETWTILFEKHEQRILQKAESAAQIVASKEVAGMREQLQTLSRQFEDFLLTQKQMSARQAEMYDELFRDEEKHGVPGVVKMVNTLWGGYRVLVVITGFLGITSVGGILSTILLIKELLA